MGAGMDFGGLGGPWAGVAGVDTCENSVSEGACEVAGVSSSEGAAIVEVSDSATSGTCSAIWRAVSSTVTRGGRATPSMSFRFCHFRRCLVDRGGKLESGTEYHGRVG